MWTTWLFLCFVRVKVWLSGGLSVETVMIQWGYWRVMWRWGCRLAKGRSHTCFVSPRESCGTRQEWCLHLRCSSWAPHRWAYETLCCPPSWGGCGGPGVWRVWQEAITAINHPGWSWDPSLLDEPDRGKEHGAKATWKALGVPLSVRGWGWSQRRETKGITTRSCGAK